MITQRPSTPVRCRRSSGRARSSLVDRVDLAGLPDDEPAVHDGDPDDLIYVIYTSGSTGRPKGVCLTHANVLRLLALRPEHYGFDETDVWPLFHSFAFDVSVWEMWGALLYGGQLVVVPAAVDPVAERIARPAGRTPGDGPEPDAVGVPRPGGPGRRPATHASTNWRCGRWSSPARNWTARRSRRGSTGSGSDGSALVNMYGITETTVHSTFYRITRADLESDARQPDRPSAGRPAHPPARRRTDELVPIGVPGEIYVGGPGCRPRLPESAGADRAALRARPVRAGPAARLYRSGDLARRRPDGSLEFCGRIDDQVKIRGYRDRARRDRGHAVGAPRRSGTPVVVVREHGRRPAPGRLRRPVGRRRTPGRRNCAGCVGPDACPTTWCPAAFVSLDALPLTTNGKLDRAALPAPDDAAVGSPSEYVARRPPLRRSASPESGASSSPSTRSGWHDRFFDLGGHSILIAQMVAEAQLVGLRPSVRMLYENRTLAELAAAVELSPTAPAELNLKTAEPDMADLVSPAQA